MINILKYDLKQFVRENIFVLLIMVIVTGIYFPSFSTLNNKYFILIFNIYGLSFLFFLLGLLNKGIWLQIIVDFPTDTFFFLRYLSFKFQTFALIVYSIFLWLMKIFFNVDLFRLIPFYIFAVYLALSYFFLICLYFGRRTNFGVIDALVLLFILLFALAIFNILFYVIELWLILPIFAIAIFFNLFFVKSITKILSPIVFDILESSNESN